MSDAGPEPRSLEELREALIAALADAVPTGAEAIGIAVATVELERAAREWESVGPFVPGVDDGWLGARSLVAAPGPLRLILLEPSTEGRLAAALARHGEGAVALYLRAPAPAPAATDASLRPTPLGPARLATPERRYGPHLLLIEGEPVPSAA